MTFAMPGVFSSIDTTALVQAELAAMARPLNNLASRKASYEAKKNAISDIESRIRQLYTAVGSLDDASALRKVTASVADKEVVTVSTSDGATEGSHTIEVNQLATAERRVHSGMADLTTLVGAGTFSYNYDGVDNLLDPDVDCRG